MQSRANIFLCVTFSLSFNAQSVKVYQSAFTTINMLRNIGMKIGKNHHQSVQMSLVLRVPNPTTTNLRHNNKLNTSMPVVLLSI